MLSDCRRLTRSTCWPTRSVVTLHAALAATRRHTLPQLSLSLPVRPEKEQQIADVTQRGGEPTFPVVARCRRRAELTRTPSTIQLSEFLVIVAICFFLVALFAIDSNAIGRAALIRKSSATKTNSFFADPDVARDEELTMLQQHSKISYTVVSIN